MLQFGLMRIVHVTCAHEWDDVRIYERMAQSAALDGMDITVVCPAPCDGAPSPSESIRITCIDRPKSRADRFCTAARAACRLAATMPADAYHLHDPELLPWAALSGTLARKCIFDSHEDIAAAVLSRAWIPRPARPAMAAATRLALASLLPRLAGTVAATPAIFAKLPSVNRLAVVQNFPAISVPSEPAPARERVAAYIGTLNAIRGADVLWRTAALLGNWGIRVEVAGLVRESPPSRDGEAQPVLLGNLDRGGVNRLLARASVGLVLFQPEPNHLASQPNKIFEYMTAGVPVVASDFPLWRQVVAETGAGVVVDPRDAHAVAVAVAQIIDRPETARRMSDAGRRAVRERFNWEPEWRKLRDAYVRVANS